MKRGGKNLCKRGLWLTIAMMVFANVCHAFGSSEAGWQRSDWFGSAYHAGNGWVFHPDHGWIYAESAGDWNWIWDLETATWLATSEASYPAFYSPRHQAWLAWLPQTRDPRVFQNLASGTRYDATQGMLRPQHLHALLDAAMQLLASDGTSLETVLSEIQSLFDFAHSVDTAQVTCPAIQRTPPGPLNFANPPESLQLGIDFGSNGCAFMPDGPVRHGRVNLLVSGFAFSSGGSAYRIGLAATNYRDGSRSVMNGDLTVDFAVTMTIDDEIETETHYINAIRTETQATFTATQFLTFGDLLDGHGHLIKHTIERQIQSKADPGDFREETEVDYLLTLSTTGFGDLIEFVELRMQPAVCADFPTSGHLLLTIDGTAYRITFDQNCSGNFLLEYE